MPVQMVSSRLPVKRNNAAKTHVKSGMVGFLLLLIVMELYPIFFAVLIRRQMCLLNQTAQ